MAGSAAFILAGLTPSNERGRHETEIYARQGPRLRRPSAFDDVEHGVFADSEAVADFSVGLTGIDEFQDAWVMTVGFDCCPGCRPNKTPRLRAAAMPERTRSRSKPPFKLRQCGHQGCNQLALRGAQVELQAGLGDEGDRARPCRQLSQQRQGDQRESAA